jgi:hypothetical protein
VFIAMQKQNSNKVFLFYLSYSSCKQQLANATSKHKNKGHTKHAEAISSKHKITKQH